MLVCGTAHMFCTSQSLEPAQALLDNYLYIACRVKLIFTSASNQRLALENLRA